MFSNMRMVSKETIDGKVVLTTETKGLFRKKIRKFEVQREYPKGYFSWLELPNRILVSDILAFQLDAWHKSS